MIKEIVTVKSGSGCRILSTKSEAIPESETVDICVIVEDLIDTAKNCQNPSALGLSANQIGELVRIFVMKWGNEYIPIVNPVVVKASEKTRPYWEGCLSRPGLREIKTTRHKSITLEFFDPRTDEVRQQTFRKRDAVVVQHEIDHLNGVMV